MKTVFALSLLLIAAMASAATVRVVSPVFIEAKGGETIDLGTMGPGQTLAIIVDNNTGEISRESMTISNKTANWNVIRVLPEGMPTGWFGEDSPSNINPLKANVIAAKDAADGDYTVKILAVDDYEGVSNLEFLVKATVSRNVFSMTITKEPVKMAPKETALIEIELENTGSAADVFQVTLTGLPQGFEQEKSALVPQHGKARMAFEFQAPETGEYKLQLEATSQSSPQINARTSTRLYVGSGLASDAKAAARGVLLYPSPHGLAYALIALASALLG